MAEKNRKLDPMDPQVFNIKRPRLFAEEHANMHNELSDEYQARRAYQDQDSFDHNLIRKIEKKAK